MTYTITHKRQFFKLASLTSGLAIVNRTLGYVRHHRHHRLTLEPRTACLAGVLSLADGIQGILFGVYSFPGATSVLLDGRFLVFPVAALPHLNIELCEQIVTRLAALQGMLTGACLAQSWIFCSSLIRGVSGTDCGTDFAGAKTQTIKWGARVLA